jgi:hypothetical protein
MLQRLTLASLVVCLFATSACQSVSTGLEKSVARANDTAAIGALRAISTAQRSYSLSNAGEYGTIQQLADAGLLDVRFSGDRPVKDYVITMNVVPKEPGAAEGSYTCNADPDPAIGLPGRHLYIDSTDSGIHANDTQPATADDQTIQ